MSQTHRLDIRGDVVTKTYVDWTRNEHMREWTALQVISTARPDLVPAPLRLERPTPLRPRPSITMSLLPGRPLTGCLTAQQLEGLHLALAALWSIPPTGVRPIEHAAFVQRIRQSIASWQGSGIVAEAHMAAAEWLARPTADELAKPLQVVIGHGDPNLANYLWDSGRIRIVDFEDAGQSDLAIELANLVEHIASRGNEWAAFLERFPVNAERLRTARRLFATFWLTLLRPGGASAHRNLPGTAELQSERVLDLLESG
jgi:Ser/Thr protein kinase RdoA (MazF antagonist)